MGRQEGSGKGLDGKTYSIELCGGTHVRRTGEIGVFTIVSEGASSAGVRRIEALTGAEAFRHLKAQENRLAQAAAELRARPEDVPERLAGLLAERKTLQAELSRLRRELAMSGGESRAEGTQPREVAGVPFVAQLLKGVSGRDLPPLIDEIKGRIGSGAVLLITDTGGKAAVAAGVTPDLTERISAVDLVRAAVVPLGGRGGGGRPDMAQGGGRDVAQADAAIAAAEAVLAAQEVKA